MTSAAVAAGAGLADRRRGPGITRAGRGSGPRVTAPGNCVVPRYDLPVAIFLRAGLPADPLLTAMHQVVAGVSVILWAFGVWAAVFAAMLASFAGLPRRHPSPGQQAA